MPARRSCSFCGNEIEPGTGKMFIRKDGTVFLFCSHKCQSNMLHLGRVPRWTPWTQAFRRAAGRAATEEAIVSEEVPAPAEAAPGEVTIETPKGKDIPADLADLLDKRLGPDLPRRRRGKGPGMAERTFVLLKPDAVQRALVGEILGRFERRGLKVVAMKMLRVTRSLGETYYAEHRGKAFFEPLMSYIAAGPVVAMVLEGDGAVAIVRKMMGKTNSAEAEPGTVRGDLALTIGRNIIHGSDSLESAKREIPLFFKPDEIHAYARVDEAWLRD